VSKKLFDASLEALGDSEVKARLEKQGNLAVPSVSQQEFKDWALKEGKASKVLTERSGAGK